MCCIPVCWITVFKKRLQKSLRLKTHSPCGKFIRHKSMVQNQVIKNDWAQLWTSCLETGQAQLSLCWFIYNPRNSSFMYTFANVADRVKKGDIFNKLINNLELQKTSYQYRFVWNYTAVKIRHQTQPVQIEKCKEDREFCLRWKQWNTNGFHII